MIAHSSPTLIHYCMYGGAWVIIINKSTRISVGISYVHICFYTISILNDTCLTGSSGDI